MFKTLPLILALFTLCSGPLQADAEPTKPFYVGVYIYDYQVRASAENLGEDYWAFLEKHLKILKNHGVNVIHLAVSKPEEFDKHLALVKKYDIKLLPQLDFVYFHPPESEAAQALRAERAGVFIARHGVRSFFWTGTPAQYLGPDQEGVSNSCCSTG